MTKNLRSIQFFSDRVIVEMSHGEVFQFCERCDTGRHAKEFLQRFAPAFNVSALNYRKLRFLERQFFYTLANGTARRTVKREIHELVRASTKQLEAQHDEKTCINSLKFF